MDFEPNRSFTYRFSRYIILPELQQLPDVQSGEPFLLRKLAWPLIDKYVTPEQQAIRVKKARSDGEETIGQMLHFYVPFLARELGIFINLGNGEFRAHTTAEVSDKDLENLADTAIEAGDEIDDDFEGYIYAFSFPSIIKDDTFPIKVGKTTGNVDARVADQCKGSASFEQPRVLGTWPVKRVGPTELAIHNTLKARGKHREDAPGREWFNTTIAEITAIIEFVTK